MPTYPIRIYEAEYRILQRLTRRYALSYGSLISGLVEEIEDWDDFVDNHWVMCTYCGAANGVDEVNCLECDTELPEED